MNIIEMILAILAAYFIIIMLQLIATLVYITILKHSLYNPFTTQLGYKISICIFCIIAVLYYTSNHMILFEGMTW